MTTPLPLAGRPTLLAKRHMVSTVHYLASMAGMRTLERGGNAIDAGVAAAICINVLEPDMTAFGGVAPMMVFRAGADQPEVLDGLGRWPSGRTLAEHRARYGDDLPPGIPRTVTPGAPDAYLTALARYGVLTLAEVLEPAIDLARGFHIHATLADALARAAPRLRGWPTSARVFLRDGQPLQRGDLLVQADLANTFERLVRIEREHAASGRAAAIMAARDDIYTGSIGEALLSWVQQHGGALSAEDMASHRVRVEAPVQTTYRGLDVYACGPWSQGPLIPMTLNLLEGFDVSGMGPGSLAFLHHYTEALKLAAADREAFFGDPDMIDVPIEGLVSKAYADERRRLIRDDSAWPELPPAGDPWPFAGRNGRAGRAPEKVLTGPRTPDTSFVCVVDADGNAFSVTPSDSALEMPLVPELGMIVSARGSQFWLDEQHPAGMAPGKRPRLTPNPAMLARADGLRMPIGCPGGDAQCQAMVQVICNIFDFGLEIQPAIEAPRVVSASFPDSFFPHVYQPGLLKIESRVSEAVASALADLGHTVEPIAPYAREAAAVCTIRRHGDGALEGGADPRRTSYALGW